MYNRYIPQPDGSFRRSRVQEPHRPVPPKTDPPCLETEPQKPDSSPQHEHSGHRTVKQPMDTSVSGFFRRILPKDFDTGDLLIIVLLLLMAGDCTEDRNTALLTLVLYFFM